MTGRTLETSASAPGSFFCCYVVTQKSHLDEGTQQTEAVVSALQGEYLSFKKVFWFQGAFPPGVSMAGPAINPVQVFRT
jgi:hypothetical protein